MAHHGTYTYDDRILRALLLLTLRAEPLSPEDSDAADCELDVELTNDGLRNARNWDTLMRSRLPRA